MGVSVLQPSTVASNLDVYIDEHLLIEANTRHWAKTCFYHLRRIRCIRWQVYWYCHVWIIVTVCLSSVHSLHFTVCNECKTLQLNFSVAHLHEHMRQLLWNSSTGLHCRAEFNSNCALWCTIFDTASPRSNF